MLQGTQGSQYLFVHLYMHKYPGTNYKEIKALGEEETKAKLEESQCEGLKKSKQ